MVEGDSLLSKDFPKDQTIDRGWFDSMRSYLENDLQVPHDIVEQFSVHAFEIDEDCETLLAMINETLRKSVESKDIEEFLPTLWLYYYRIDHLGDHIKEMLAILPTLYDEASKNEPEEDEDLES